MEINSFIEQSENNILNSKEKKIQSIQISLSLPFGYQNKIIIKNTNFLLLVIFNKNNFNNFPFIIYII